MGHDSQIGSAYQASTDTYDYSEVFTYLQPELEAVDFAVGNLEVTLAGPPFKGYPQFSSPDALAVAARDHGMDVLVTANNHSADRRSPGIVRTLQVLDSLGIQHTGTFASQADRDANNLLVLEKMGVRVGLLNYTFSTNGIPVAPPTIVNRIDREQMAADVRAAEADSLDKLIVFVHWGREYEHTPYRTQTSLSEYLFGLGVDIIVGAHPHVIQPMVWDRSGPKDQLVVYSLGNFVSNQRDRGRDGGSMLKITLGVNNDSVYIAEAGYKLIWVYKWYSPGKLHFHVLPGAAFEQWPVFFETKGSWDAFQTFMSDSRKLYGRENFNIPEYRWRVGKWRLERPEVFPIASLPYHWPIPASLSARVVPQP